MILSIIGLHLSCGYFYVLPGTNIVVPQVFQLDVMIIISWTEEMIVVLLTDKVKNSRKRGVENAQQESLGEQANHKSYKLCWLDV